MFSPYGWPVEWTISLIVARCSAQVCALAASVSLHTSGGTPTAARSLLWISRMVLTKSVLLLPCDAPAGGAAGGGVSVAGGAAGGGVSVAGGAAGGGVSVAGGASAVSPSPAGGACVSPSPAGGDNVGQLPLASGVEPSGHDCAYEICSIDDGDCTVRIAAVTRITLIIIDSLPFISYIN